MAQLKEQWKTEKLCQRCVRVLSFQGEITVNQSSCKKNNDLWRKSISEVSLVLY